MEREGMAHVSHIADFEKRRRVTRQDIETRDVVHLFNYAAASIEAVQTNSQRLPSAAVERYFSEYVTNFHGLSDAVVGLFYDSRRYNEGNILLESINALLKEGASQSEVLRLCLDFTHHHVPELNETVRRMLKPALVNLVTQEQSNA